MTNAEQQIVVVTAADGAIGTLAALEFAAGSSRVVAILSGSNSGTLERAGIESQVDVDLCDESALAAAFDRVVKKHGRIDVVFHAGVPIATRGLTSDLPMTDFIRLIRLAHTSTREVCYQALRHFMEGGSGLLITVAGEEAVAPKPGLVTYGVSAAAVVTFTNKLVKKVSGSGVDVCCVVPGEEAHGLESGTTGPQDEPQWTEPLRIVRTARAIHGAWQVRRPGEVTPVLWGASRLMPLQHSTLN